MNKKKNTKIIMMLIVCVLLVAAASIWIVAGWKMRNEDKTQDLDHKDSKEIVDEFLTAYSNQDAGCALYLQMGNEGDTMQFNDIQGVLAKKISYSITSSKESNQVGVEIENVDFKEVFNCFLNESDQNIIDKGKIREELIGKLGEENVPTRTFNVEIELSKENKIIMDSKLSNALLGGYPEFLDELIGGSADEKDK